MKEKRIGIVGAGAAGYFASINCAEKDPHAKIFLFEKSRKSLTKVAISGGGRCNVTHACYEPKELVANYPRGSRELLGPFYVWQPNDTINWFEERGVPLKTEEDGRVFPISDTSSSIVNCLRESAEKSGVILKLQEGVDQVEKDASGKFNVKTSQNNNYELTHLLLATGGGKNAEGYQIAQRLNHTIKPPQPSLFSFHIDDPILIGLQGLSVAKVNVKHEPSGLEQSGPVVVTRNGLSGPAILKLSAWGARVFADCNYTFDMRINWLGSTKKEAAQSQLSEARNTWSKRLMVSDNPLSLPRRLWKRLLTSSNIDLKTQWAHVTNKQLQSLSQTLTERSLSVKGKSMNKEEFVTCGGISLKEVDFKTMESKLTPKLYFSGEILDIDGVTGGFNFQAAWTTAMIASMAVTNS